MARIEKLSLSCKDAEIWLRVNALIDAHNATQPEPESDRILPTGTDLRNTYIDASGGNGACLAACQLATVEAVCKWLSQDRTKFYSPVELCNQLLADAQARLDEAM